MAFVRWFARSPARAWALTLALALAGCGGPLPPFFTTGGTPPPGPPPGQATFPAAGQTPASRVLAWPPDPKLQPPPATLQAGRQSQTAGIANFCWRSDGSGSLCVDAIGIATAAAPLAASPSFTGTLQLPLADLPDTLLAEVIPVTTTRELAGAPAGARWWPYEPGQRFDLPLGSRVPISLTLQPGLHVLRVFARWPGRGQVDYGFLLDVPLAGGLESAYPLAAGARWVYSATVSSGAGRSLRWQGLITETVTSALPRGDAWIYEVSLAGHPTRSGSAARFYRYVQLAGRLYLLPGPQDPAGLLAAEGRGFAAREILAWPLAAGQDLPGEPGVARWQVEAAPQVVTPAGRFSGCYRIFSRAATEETSRWFCPGTGVVRYEHHAPGDDEVWELFLGPGRSQT